MKYKANIDIDKYKKGDEVPADIAVVWKSMYKFSPVDEVKEQVTPQPKVEEKPKTTESKEEKPKTVNKK